MARTARARAEHDGTEIVMIDQTPPAPDLNHLAWAIEHRAEIQRTLLALYEFVRRDSITEGDWVRNSLLDDLIAAAFSLWRAVFLAESDRDWDAIRKGQERFLASVVSDNAITYSDDKKNRAWSVSFYLENAKHRLATAHGVAAHHMAHKSLSTVMPLLRLKGTGDVRLTRYEWECVHIASRIIFKVLDPELELPIKNPTLPGE